MRLAEHQSYDDISITPTRQPNIAAVCWLTNEVRTASYAHYLNATLYNIHYISNRYAFIAPLKYIPQCIKTWAVLSKQSPDAVYVMNPPVFAALSVYLYCFVSRRPFVMDTHSPSLYARKWKWTLPLQRFLAKQALINIVDQPRFRDLFGKWGAQSIVLERPPLDIEKLIDNVGSQSNSPNSRYNSEGHLQASSGNNSSQIDLGLKLFSVTLIGQFAADEPVDVVVAAARELPDVTFFILGNKAHAPRQLIRSAPRNVIFTGYLSGMDYWNHLASTDAVMTLTTFKYSLLGGAQEGMAMGKPLILSNQPVLTDYFSKGTVFIEHTVESIIQGVNQTRSQVEHLGKESAALAKEKRIRWETAFESLQQVIAQHIDKHRTNSS